MDLAGVLIVTDLGPQLYRSYGRIPGLMRHLVRRGYDTIAISESIGVDAPAELGTIIELPRRLPGDALLRKPPRHIKPPLAGGGSPRMGAKGIRDILSLIRSRAGWIVRSILWYPDQHRSWIREAIERGEQLIKTGRVVVVISSSVPVSSHVIAATLKRRHPDIIWIADLRDLWTMNQNYPFTKFRQRIDGQLERRVMALADEVVVLAKPLAHRLSIFLRRDVIRVIPSGFDERTWVHGSEPQPDQHFTITYTGQLYYNRQDVTKLLASVHDLIIEKVIEQNVIRLKFMGSRDPILIGMIREYQLENCTELLGWLPMDQALAAQRTAQVLFFPNWEDGNEQGIYTGKIFEYLAACRPILATGGGPDVVSELLEETSAGVAARTVSEVKRAIAAMYAEYRQLGSVPYRGDPDKVRVFSHGRMAERFIALFDRDDADHRKRDVGC